LAQSLYSDRFRSDREGFVLYSDGFRSDREGFVLYSDGFRSDREGFVLYSDGFRSNQEGFVLYSDGFRSNREGFVLCPNLVVRARNSPRALVFTTAGSIHESLVNVISLQLAGRQSK
jgi:hypothetical protein